MRGCSRPDSVRVRIGLVTAFIVALTGLSWLSAGIAYHNRPALLSASGIAYSLGLRHGLDADHISAIDNVTRKLITSGQLPVGVGMFFSIGHSSLIFLGCFILYYTESAWESSNPTSLKILSITSSVMASLFLIGMGLVNLIQLRKTYIELRRIKKEKVYKEEDANNFQSRGLISYCAGGLLNMVTSSPWMLLVGFVFGLGFDTTASVTAIMATAGTVRSHSGVTKPDLQLSEAFILPLLFTCGMAAMDTADSIIMLGSYKWSDRKIVRKLFFNFVILTVSVTAALSIGIIIGLRLVVDLTSCGEKGVAFCEAIEYVDAQFQYIGLALTLLIVFIWVAGYFYYTRGPWAQLEDEIVHIKADSTTDPADSVDICDLEARLEDTTHIGERSENSMR